jgi:hypothetical protein
MGWLTETLGLNKTHFERAKKDRVLEERSHLAVEFPQSDDRVFRTYIPFLENPKITEAGASILQEYQLLGRAGTIYSYGGAESRAFNVTFNINLMHMLHLESTEGITDKFKRGFNLFFSGKEQSKARFKLTNTRAARVAGEEPTGGIVRYQDGTPVDAAAAARAIERDRIDTADPVGDPDIRMGKGYSHAETHRDFYNEAIRQIAPGLTSFQDFFGLTGNDGRKDFDKLIDLVYVWVNLIRGTILNNSSNTTQGPPIVRLTHGPMYNNVPCVVNDYDIKIVDDVGFEVQTLTPKKIEIQLSLSEVRTGNYGTFAPGKVEAGDNLAGWEAIISDNTIDPYNGAITTDRDYLLTGRDNPGQVK